jgi:hypothetical protein
MADRTFASLVPRVQASVPGCPHATIVQYIRDSAIRTCERTLTWRYVEDKFDLVAGISQYAYNKPTNTDVHVLFDAMVNDRPLDRLTLEEALFRYPAWADLYSGEPASVAWSLTSSNALNTAQFNQPLLNNTSPYVLPESIVANAATPQAICQVTPDRYVVLPLPDGTTTYTVRMFYGLKPKRNSAAMDEVVFNDLEEAIFHGALQHLLVLPVQAWSDRELAAYHAKQYVSTVAERRARANLGDMRGSMRIKNQPFM